ncbi:MAG TPA: RNA polymerase sigma factor [Candidatus Limnocylindrales bacterium]
MDQRSLVEQAQRGDHDAFAVLVRATIARLDAAARLILRDRELARDAVQDTLIAAWRNMAGLRDPDRFDAWLHRLLVRACIDVLRRRRSRPIEVELPVLGGPVTGNIDTAVADREIVEVALRRLDPSWRALVVLHYFLGMPLPEASAVLGIPLGTAKSRLHRSLDLMRTSIAAEVDIASPARGTVT